jgi:hypothetical protein
VPWPQPEIRAGQQTSVRTRKINRKKAQAAHRGAFYEGDGVDQLKTPALYGGQFRQGKKPGLSPKSAAATPPLLPMEWEYQFFSYLLARFFLTAAQELSQNRDCQFPKRFNRN